MAGAPLPVRDGKGSGAGGQRSPYFLSVEAPRAVSPSAIAKRSAVKRGRFSASEGAVCAKSDANWGVGLGRGGAALAVGRRLVAAGP
jgi:hypothetical protein